MYVCFDIVPVPKPLEIKKNATFVTFTRNCREIPTFIQTYLQRSLFFIRPYTSMDLFAKPIKVPHIFFKVDFRDFYLFYFFIPAFINITDLKKEEIYFVYHVTVCSLVSLVSLELLLSV
jgi:hypothetical protein